MKNCPKCNQLILDDDAKFCIECGAVLDADSDTPKLSKKIEVSKKKSKIFLGRKPKIPNLKNEQTLNLTNFIQESSKFTVNLHWECLKDPVLDFTAFLTNSKGTIDSEEEVIFYNNPCHATKSVELFDSEENSKFFKVDFKKIPAEITRIVFVFSVDYDDEEQTFDEFGVSDEDIVPTFKDVNSIFISVENTEKTILEYNLDKNFSDGNALIVCEIYRQDKNWIFRACNRKFYYGLAEVCEIFGLEVE